MTITLTPDQVNACIFAAIFCLCWLVRLEAKVLNQGRDHVKLEAAVEKNNTVIWEKFTALQTSMNQILQGIGRVEGRLSINTNKEN